MLLKFTYILLFGLAASFLSFLLYPSYIRLLKKRKAGKTIREDARSGGEASIFKELHQHKAGTPTMGGGLFLIVMLIMIGISYILQQQGYITFTLINRNETYMLLFAFFAMGGLGLVDDYLNIKGTSKVKGLSSKLKLIWMFLFSGFISRWFYSKLGIDYINFWPIAGEVSLGVRYPILTFFFTVGIVNAINITDGLDGLVGGLMLLCLGALAIAMFSAQRYLATTIVAIVLGCLLAFLRYNINPARVFMGDAGALGLGGLVATIVYLLNINTGVIIPFVIMFLIFWVEIGSSFLQMFWKKTFKKKLFLIAPYHHQLEKQGHAEHTIVMRFWLIQGILAAIALMILFYQMAG